MRTFLHMTAGAFLCIIISLGIGTISRMADPGGAISNEDFPLIRINVMDGPDANGQYELRKGESKHFPYGRYTIFIPETGASFVLFKNSRGTCDIHSASGVLLVETNSNANIMSEPQK